MRMFERVLFTAGLLSVALAVLSVYWLERNVKQLEAERARLTHGIAREEQRLHGLRGEWALVTSPAHLRSLKGRALVMQPVSLLERRVPLRALPPKASEQTPLRVELPSGAELRMIRKPPLAAYRAARRAQREAIAQAGRQPFGHAAAESAPAVPESAPHERTTALSVWADDGRAQRALGALP